MSILRPNGPITTRVAPDYDGFGLGNIPAWLCEIAEVPWDGMLPPLAATVRPVWKASEIRTVIVFLADAMGERMLLEGLKAGRAPCLASLVAGERSGWTTRLTSVFPSSTVPALTTLATGAPPGQHGLLGWVTHFEELGGPTEVVRCGPRDRPGSWSDGGAVVPSLDDLMGLSTIHQRFSRSGVATCAVAPAWYVGTPFTTMLYRGAHYHPYDHVDAIPDLVLAALRSQSRRDRLLVYVYHPPLDHAAHTRGPYSEEFGQSLAELDTILGRVLSVVPEGGKTLLAIIADHGHISTDATRLMDFASHPELLGLLVHAPTGERRVAYLHIKPGQVEAVSAYVTERLGGDLEVHPAADLVRSGLFGPVNHHPGLAARIGQLVLLPRGNQQLVCTGAGIGPTLCHLGDHGALMPEEMWVPLITCRI
ncbi:MAG: alkaline phosphatase family protein [Candidatus Riflebacteria bacterium]|nr:alkaline phosphatase family protein [Candidatus Riflebacteria bacterium]